MVSAICYYERCDLHMQQSLVVHRDVTYAMITYTHKFGAGESMCAIPLDWKLCPWGQWGWLEGSSRLYGMKIHRLVMKTFRLGEL